MLVYKIQNFLASRYKTLSLVISFLIATGFTANYLVEQNQLKNNIQASLLYDQLLEAKDPSKIAKDIMNLYKRSPYATLSAMHLAQIEIEKNNLEGAVSALMQISHQGYHYKDPLWSIVKLRLARLLHHLGRDDEALAELKDNNIDELTFAELKADIYAKTDIKKAKALYELALNQPQANKLLLAQKISELELKQK